MRKLLIVDDEKQIRLGVEAMVQRALPGRFTTVMAADGEEALADHLAAPADIVITDIRMPGMDGLALIRKLQTSPRKPAVLILSGHDDFQYAKEAIRFEVKEYLLKPIKRDELVEAVRRTEAELLRGEETASRLQESDSVLEQLRASQLGNILMDEGMSPAKVLEICERIGLQDFAQGYHVGVLRHGEGDYRNLHYDALLSRMERFMRDGADEGACAVHLTDRDGNLVLIANDAEIYRKLAAGLQDQPFQRALIGISNRSADLGALRQSYLQAKTALKYGFLHPKAVMISYGSISGRPRQEDLPLENIRRIANMLGTHRDKQMRSLLLEVLDVAKMNTWDIEDLEAISTALNELVFDRVFHVYGEESVDILKMYKKVGNMYSCGTFHEYLHDVENLLMLLNEYINGLKSVHLDQKEMKKALEYIHANYNKELSMTMVSNHVSLNYTYFSQSFKSYTGENFVNYLKRIRILKAKELLQQTDDKVFEVGQKVGYDNPKQFARTFRELEGISPLEYRHKFF
ncbi:hypothetical protein SY83_03630 [Paenibacillus swuensis]|uniref:AraC family transcriptional regulator n=2 Tax=Paenibacillus swuensis TaxID=1178515 RepID=A0A172TP70_9BACL|nr:hypothetical protein SY83_03630 [Paenibacillus swuensis]